MLIINFILSQFIMLWRIRAFKELHNLQRKPSNAMMIYIIVCEYKNIKSIYCSKLQYTSVTRIAFINFS